MTHSLRVWHHFLGNDFPKKEIVFALAKKGIHLDAPNGEVPHGLGIVFFEDISSELCDYLSRVSCGNQDRILAVDFSQPDKTNKNEWKALQAGASDVLVWNDLPDPVSRIQARLKRWAKIDEILESPDISDGLIGKSPPWISVLRQIVEVAYFTTASILITGESGTGKEMVATMVHDLDQRKNKRDLIILDCTTIVPELSGSEFFGHERGAFTGATTARDGAFALADGGTLFLDEVGDLPLQLQAQLLRVIQEKSYKRVGGNEWKNTDFRLVCATNRDLLQEVKSGRFRSDLYYRIANWTCILPPLRERREDIIDLADYFIRQSCSEKEPPRLNNQVKSFLMSREYEGNIRDLKQLVSRIMYRYVGCGPITLGDIPDEERPRSELPTPLWNANSMEGSIRYLVSSGFKLKDIGRMAEDIAIKIVVSGEGGNLQRASKKLGVTDRALQLRRARRTIDQ